MIIRKIGGRRGVSVDPFAASVTFLALFQSGNDATTQGISDLTGRHALTANNGAVIDTAQVGLGASSLELVAASSQNVVAAASTDFDPTASGLTIECTVRRNGLPSAGQFRTMAGRNGGEGDRSWLLLINDAGVLAPAISSDGTNYDIATGLSGAAGAIPDLTLTHVAMVHDPVGDEFRFYIDGSLVRTISTALDPFSPVASQLQLGSSQDIGYYWNGHLAAVRITRAARYSAAFTPPTLTDYLLSLG
jgi:hypothetical protein